MTRKTHAIFNVETNELIRGPFTEKGAKKSREAVIRTLVQHVYLNDKNSDYRVFLIWVQDPIVNANPTVLYKSMLSKDHVDFLLKHVSHYEKVIQIKEVDLQFK